MNLYNVCVVAQYLTSPIYSDLCLNARRSTQTASVHSTMSWPILTGRNSSFVQCFNITLIFSIVSEMKFEKTAVSVRAVVENSSLLSSGIVISQKHRIFDSQTALLWLPTTLVYCHSKRREPCFVIASPKPGNWSNPSQQRLCNSSFECFTPDGIGLRYSISGLAISKYLLLSSEIFYDTQPSNYPLRWYPWVVNSLITLRADIYCIFRKEPDMLITETLTTHSQNHIHLCYSLGNRILKQVSNNYIGLHISNNPKWHTHISRVINEASTTQGFLLRILDTAPWRCHRVA